jgi:phosphoglycerol transferase MdoB-like AlkP superfamily enzyme
LTGSIRFVAAVYIRLLLLFTVLRLIFVMHNYSKVQEAGLVSKSFWVGLKMDFSAASYLILPFLVLLFIWSLMRFPVEKVCYILYCFIVVLVSFLGIADAALYQFWGFRLDTTPLLYLNHFNEAMASVSTLFIVLVLLEWIILSYFYIRATKSLFAGKISNGKKLFVAGALICISAFQMIPIRGGLQLVPINPGSVYFSNNMFANHTATNTFWNVGQSFLEADKTKSAYYFMSDEEAERIVNRTTCNNTFSADSLLNTKKPNIIFVIIESFTANLVGSLGGEKGFTPHFDSLAKEGLLFKNLYSNGDRTDKGIQSVLSGFPNLPGGSVITIPNKSNKLHGVISDFNNAGYNSYFFYGGEKDFGGIGGFIRNQHTKTVVDKNDFSESTFNSKWGAQDEFVFEKALHELQKETKPFVATILTLTNHEPFELPGVENKTGMSDAEKFKKTFAYTDKALNDFVAECKKHSWWNNTLMILVADHGHALPAGLTNYQPEKFHIPMLWLGGALKVKGQEAETYGSQINIIPSLYQSLGLPVNAYPFQNSLLSNCKNAVAFYAFNEGFGVVSSGGALTWNVHSQKIISFSGDTSGLVNTGKAYLQVISKKFREL